MPMPEIVTKKFGPLPGWAWGGLGLGVALAMSTWRKNQAATAESAVTQSYALPETLQPTYVFQNYDQDVEYGDQTTINVPPGGGRPTTPPPVPPPAPPKPVPPPPPPPPKPPIVFVPKPPAPPSGQWSVPMIPFRKGQPKGTPSTLWGLAEKYYKGNGNLWSKIWNAPQNAALRSKRKHWDFVQPGDKFWIPN